MNNISKTSLRKNRTQQPISIAKNPIDFVKWLAFFVTLLGIQAWIAGEAYYEGYWGLLGLDGPFSSTSLQRTAFVGFLGVFTNWQIVSAVIAATGCYVVFLAIGREKAPNYEPPLWIVKIKAWLKRFTFDKSTGMFGSVLLLIAILVFLTVFLLGIWIVSAHSAGANRIKTQICEMREGKALITTAKLTDGTMVSGLLLDRSDKFTTIMDVKLIHVLSTGDKQQILYSTQMPKVKCST